ncbi:hypothetical protein DPMN_017424 [Dreissena polymorpha]|uniref:Uncharacterized protein n=1 Tax=Dreissena polymorpha TaxID=45954 RepID=A0A9D4S7F3_DREPO|nr:hypothetical protein DPMN_017424 [Dreissena polymorpha]
MRQKAYTDRFCFHCMLKVLIKQKWLITPPAAKFTKHVSQVRQKLQKANSGQETNQLLKKLGELKKKEEAAEKKEQKKHVK